MESSEKLDSRISKITVHYAELNLQNLLMQPVVCMHIVDSSSGTYVKKQEKGRAVMSYYENQREIDYIMPVMTQPCLIQGKKSQILNWEESFVLNENFDYLLKPELDIIIFFEVIDLIPMSFTKYHYERLNENGMQKVAWAFVKVIGPNKIRNIGSKLHLQLYKPCPVQKGSKSSQLDVFEWWSKKSRTPLEASIYISFNPCEVEVVEPALRSMLPIQKETGILKKEEVSGDFEDFSTHSLETSKKLPIENNIEDTKWHRKKGENCKIPTKLSLKLESANKCQILKFSSLGRCLVAGCETSGQCYLSFFEIPSGKVIDKILAHSDVIYDIDWSEDDCNLLSASADYSVKLWNVKPLIPLAAFIHPSFVYCSKFQPSMKNVLVTACYDHVIRVWTFDKSVQLLQELESHRTSVNALCWNKTERKLFSADNFGEIKIWKIPKNINSKNYVLEEELSLEELKGIPISKIVYDYKKDGLFVFCADAKVRLLNMPSREISQTCVPNIKSPNSLRGCCSPCGNLLFLSNDDGSVSVWKDSFDEISDRMPNSSHKCFLTSMDYHPYDHILVLSTFEENGAIYIYTCNDSENLLGESDILFENSEVEIKDSKKNSLKDKKAPKIVHERYSCSTETSSDEEIRRLSLNALSNQNCLSESSSTSFEHSKMFFEKAQSQPFTAIITKSGQFSVISDGGSCNETNTYSSRNTSESGNPGRLSSKRAQRREKLKYKAKDE